MQETQYFDNIFQMNRTTSKDKVDNMNKQINDFTSYVKSLGLSPMEEVMMIYDKTKLLNSAGNDTSLEYRQLSDVVSSGKAVCAGYTNLFNECLIRMGYEAGAIESYVDGVSHMHSIVLIEDKKYGINGIYNFDPTFDFLQENNNLSNDRLDSYAFFGRSVEEINHLKEERIPRGVSNTIMKDYENHYDEIQKEIPTRTMNLVNGFFPREENKNYLRIIYNEGKDQTNWPKLNEPYIMQLSLLGMKTRRAENIPISTMEQVITNVKKVEYPNLTPEQLSEKMLNIKKINNFQFNKYFNDSRLNFDVKPDDFISEENYPNYLQKINEILSSKQDDEKLSQIIEYSNDQKQLTTHKLLQTNGEDTKVLLNGSFSSDYNFSKNFMNPLVKDFASQCPYESSQIGKPEYFNLNIRNYVANATNGCSFVIKDGNLDYIKSIDETIKSTAPIRKENNMNQQSNDNNIFQLMNEVSKEDEIIFEPPKSDVSTIMSSTSQDENIDIKEDNINDLLSDTSDLDLSSQNTNEVLDLLNSNSDNTSGQKQNDDFDISQIMNNSSEEDIHYTQNNGEREITQIMDDAGTESRIEEYNQARGASLLQISNPNSDEYIHSNFTVHGSNGELCQHTIEKITNDSKQIISQTDYQNDDLFRTSMLEPSIVDYAKTNPIINGQVKGLENGLSQYMAFSETNNVLTVNNIDGKYANYIQEEVRKIDPVIFQQQMEQYQRQAEETYSYQKVLKKNNGFLDALMLSSIVGFVAGFIGFLAYIIIKINS